MSTPAGWYDDGSGRLRWWDGELWTEHFAPDQDAETEGSGEVGSAETASAPSVDAESEPSPDSDAHVGAQVSPPEDAAAPAVDTVDADRSPDTIIDAPGGTDADAAEQPKAGGQDTVAEFAGEGQDAADPTPPSPASAPIALTTPESLGDENRISGSALASAQPTASDTESWPASPGHITTPHYPAAPGYVATPQDPAAPGHSSAPGYPTVPEQPTGSGRTAYLGYAPAIGAPAFGRGVAGAPHAGAYPVGYGALPAAAAPTGPPVVGLIGLGASALGVIFSMVPFLWGFSWLLLLGGLVVSLVSLFLRGRKWPGVTGMIVAVVGFVIAAITGVVLFITSIATYDSYDSGYDYSTDEPYFDDPAVVEAGAGETVSIEQVTGTTEVSVDSATWSAGNGLSDADNGGYLTLTLTWASVGDDTTFSPSYVEVETPTPSSKDALTPDQLSSSIVDDGSSITGILVFDIAESGTYTVLIRDELMRPAARITVTP